MSDTSIITPAYNAARFLAATLESVLSQTFADWECIVVDDGSTDETAEIATAFCRRDSRFRYVARPNQGRAIACNTGVAAASPASRYLMFLDSDDLLARNGLNLLRSYLEADPLVGTVGCQFEVIDEKGQDLGPGHRSRWVPGLLWPRQLSDKEASTPFVTFFCATGQGPFALVRRSVLAKTAGFEPTLSPFSAHEDTDIFCQLSLLAPVHYLPDRVYLKRVHGDNITRSYDRVTNSYAVLRAKWDSFVGRTAEEARVLSEAKKFYQTRFRPFRDFKVAGAALRNAAQRQSSEQFFWSLKLVRSGLAGLIGARR